MENPSQDNIVIALSAGGTGGHLYPAQSVAEDMQDQPRLALPVFLANDREIDRRALKDMPYPVLFLKGSGVYGKSIISAIRGGVQILGSVWTARRAVKRQRVRAVIAFGGYSSVSSVLAARSLGLPVYLHEQNAVPGRANRFLARYAKKIFLTFEQASAFFPEDQRARCVVTGCPVRKRVIADREIRLHPSRLRCLITGGSQGSAFFLEFLMQRLEFLNWFLDRSDILFLAGPGPAASQKAKRLAQALSAKGQAFNILPYLDRIGPAIRTADIILARSGASFLAELASIGKARTILVPFPEAVDDHQTANAEAMMKSGHSLERLEIVRQDETVRIEELLRDFAARPPVDAPRSHPEIHANASVQILEHVLADVDQD